MEILGIGPLEFIFIIFIALIILGPNDMVKAGRTIGRFLRKIVTSSEWRTIQQASKELRFLPNRLIREAGLEELKNGLNAKNIGDQIGLDELKNDYDQWKKDISTWTSPPEHLENELENNIESDQDIEHMHKNNLEESEHE